MRAQSNGERAAHLAKSYCVRGQILSVFRIGEARVSCVVVGTGLLMGAFDVPDGRSAVKCLATPRRRPIRRCHGALLKSAGDDGEHDRTRRLARAIPRSQRRGGRTGMDDSTKDLTSSERVESAIISRAEPSRAEPSRAEPSRAEPSRAEPSRAEPSRAEPSRAEPSRAEPSRAEPSRAEPSRAEPSRAVKSASRSRVLLPTTA